MTRPAIVVGDRAPPVPQPTVLPAAVAVAAIVAVVAALHASALRTDDDPPPSGLRIVETRTWRPAPAGSQWTLSRVYAAPDGQGLAFTARRGTGSDTPPIVRGGGPGEASLVEWNHLGFGYTIVGVGIAPDVLQGVAEGVVYDRTGLGTMAVPRPGDLPADLMVVDQRSGPSAGPGTGPTGAVTVLEDAATGARITVTASDDAVVTATHLASLLRTAPRGGDQLVLAFAGEERWLVSDHGGTTVVARGTGVTADDLARALEVAS